MKPYKRRPGILGSGLPRYSRTHRAQSPRGSSPVGRPWRRPQLPWPGLARNRWRDAAVSRRGRINGRSLHSPLKLSMLRWTPIPGEGPLGKGPGVGSGRSSEPAGGTGQTGKKGGRKGAYRGGPRTRGCTATRERLSQYRLRGIAGRKKSESTPGRPGGQQQFSFVACLPVDQHGRVCGVGRHECGDRDRIVPLQEPFCVLPPRNYHQVRDLGQVYPSRLLHLDPPQPSGRRHHPGDVAVIRRGLRCGDGGDSGLLDQEQAVDPLAPRADSRHPEAPYQRE